MTPFALACFLLVLEHGVSASVPRPSRYKLTSTYDATNFLKSFDLIDKLEDGNNGIADYQNLSAAQSAGLVKIQDNQVYLGVDHTKILAANEKRPSIRLESKSTWNGGILVADFAHVPAGGCGAWPAFWAYGGTTNPFQYSEIDIFEAVSLATRNAISLYTSISPCMMQHGYGPVAFTLGTARLNCGDMTPATVLDPKKDGWMRGCAVEAPEGTFGHRANERGGGIWVMQVDTDVIRAWWIPRDKIPIELKHGRTGSINPDTWPIDPVMRFTVKSCDVRKAFRKMKLILNIDFCGAYASSAWNGYAGYNNCQAATGWSQCDAFVRENPWAFKDTYFLINAIRIYVRV